MTSQQPREGSATAPGVALPSPSLESKALLLRLLDDDDVRRKLAEVIEYLIAIGAIRTRSTTFSSCRSPDGAAIPMARFPEGGGES